MLRLQRIKMDRRSASVEAFGEAEQCRFLGLSRWFRMVSAWSRNLQPAGEGFPRWTKTIPRLRQIVPCLRQTRNRLACPIPPCWHPISRLRHSIPPHWHPSPWAPRPVPRVAQSCARASPPLPRERHPIPPRPRARSWFGLIFPRLRRPLPVPRGRLRGSESARPALFATQNLTAVNPHGRTAKMEHPWIRLEFRGGLERRSA